MAARARAIAILVGVLGAAATAGADEPVATAGLETLYRAEASCVGVAQPKPPPALEIRAGTRVRCRGVTADGTCAGLHRERPRRVIVTYATTDAIPHELLHDVLCQVPRALNPYGCDRRHESPAWRRCLR